MTICLVTNIVEVGARTIQIDGFDGNQCGVDEDTNCLVDEGTHARTDLVEYLVGARVQRVPNPFRNLNFFSTGCHL